MIKKIFPYILILFLLSGIFIPVNYTTAQTCWNNGMPDLTRNTTILCSAIGGSWQAAGQPPPQPPAGPGNCTAPNTPPFCIPQEGSPPPTCIAPRVPASDGTCSCLPPNVPINGICVAQQEQEGTTQTQIYNFLAPLPCDTGPGCEGGQLKTFDPTSVEGENSKIGEYLNIMIRIFIGICAVLAVIMIVMGGIEYMTSELISNKENGKHHITGAIFGLLLALGAWTILNQINPDILNTDLSSLEKVVVVVNLEDSVPQTPVNGKYSNEFEEGEDWTKRAGQLADLTKSGARVYNSECTKVGQRNCTSTRGLKPSTLNTIHQQCPSCTLLVTGGTEFWLHGGKKGSTSHQIGNSTVDLAPNPALNAYLSGGKPLVKFKRYPQDGGPNYYEGNHWHIGP